MVIENFTVHGVHAFGYGIALRLCDVVEGFALVEVTAYNLVRVLVAATLGGAKRVAIGLTGDRAVGGSR